MIPLEKGLASFPIAVIYGSQVRGRLLADSVEKLAGLRRKGRLDGWPRHLCSASVRVRPQALLLEVLAECLFLRKADSDRLRGDE